MSETAEVATWLTRDGRKIPVTEMTDAHLANTIRYLERRIASGMYREEPELHTCPIWEISEGPCFACENDSIVKSRLESWIEIFKNEKARRASVNVV